jgi:hypothetical protein
MKTRLTMIVCAALAASPAFGAGDAGNATPQRPMAKSGLNPTPAAGTEHAQPAAQSGSAPAVAAPAPAGSVARAQITSEVRDREPVDNLAAVPATAARVYFFTEIKNQAGQKVTHRWEHNGKVMQEVPLEIGANRWRTYSYRSLDPSGAGQWIVSVIDTNGSTLSASTFNVEAAPAATAPATAPAANKP